VPSETVPVTRAPTIASNSDTMQPVQRVEVLPDGTAYTGKYTLTNCMHAHHLHNILCECCALLDCCQCKCAHCSNSSSSKAQHIQTQRAAADYGTVYTALVLSHQIECYMLTDCVMSTLHYTAAGGPQQESYTVPSMKIPGTIEAENFKEGGQGIAFFASYDVGPNAANSYVLRKSDAPIQRTESNYQVYTSNGEIAVAYTIRGQWMMYDVSNGYCNGSDYCCF
jgi:hypothetical protein